MTTTMPTLLHDVTAEADRFLAAYATVHSLLEQPEAAQGRSQGPAPEPPPALIPAARLAHSTGGRRKQKRRRFRAAPAAELATA